MRILVISGYSHPSHHRKIELLADAPDMEILHILPPGSGKTAGPHASANGQRTYQVQIVPIRSLGQVGDPHRTIHWPPTFQLRSFKPHLIHCEHEQEGLLAAEVALARSIAASHVPLILYSWQNILRQRRLAVRLVSAFTLRSAQHIMCASREAVQVLRQQKYRGGVSVQPLFGLDTRYFYRRDAAELRARLRLSRLTIGYAGRLTPEKGVDILLQAAAQVTVPIELLIIGDGPQRQQLQALSAQLGLQDRCRFVGPVAYDDMAAYLSALDLLVLPSRSTPQWKEQYGRVLVEAMACQVAVVGSDSGAIPEVIDAPECIFREGDVAALTMLIDRLAADAELRCALAERGYQRALTHYTVEQLVADILPIWRSLDQRPAQRRN
jgi:glycosyltransferase involved in cell wall biosynthesis